MKVHAPYKKFKWGHYYFSLGYRYTSEEELKDLKKMPIALGELKVDGEIINKPKPKKTAKKK